ncbi:NrtA/SsuA/CpmA family ABC transporter substrate-binding protein [Streptomyces bambusae]|uniref:ABC transporter substrate-binding protein n=1 Tax=Streptomyces bambusae TaxID=1550616 RepID=UPI001CFCA43D|nr:NrtA/SsuA/CpmA family ABC transporter substrate-binding protein [Streptomyces bambusae]MCB5167520.1 NrtA/SsuA/CpmA family ABC transporter substrate-binding protein [Streptomyces bambusae]
MSRFRIPAATLIGVVAVLTAVTSGCSAGTTGAASEADAAGRTAVTLAGSDHLGGAPVHIAQARKLWAAERVDARIVMLSTGRDALNAVLGGQAQLGVVGDLPAVTAALGGRDVRIVAELSRFSDWRLLTRSDRAITGFPALKGRRVGVPQGTNVEYALSRMLGSAGLTAADVTVVNLAPNQVPPALARGDIDAGVTFPGFYDAARTALGGRYAEVRFTGYTARTLLVAGPTARDTATTAVLRTLVRAGRAQAADPARAQRDVVAQSNGAVQSAYAAAFQPKYAYGTTLSAGLLDQLAAEAAWAKSTQGLPGPADRRALRARVHPAPLTSVDPAAVTLP